MWIYANVSNATPTGVPDMLQYANGGVAGNIYLAPLSFAGYEVAAQAFIEIQDISNYGSDPRVSGYTALVGLGPSAMGSTIYSAMGLEDTALPMMQNIFKQDLTTSNYITLLLPRQFDPDSPTLGEMTVSELVPGQEAIASQTKLPIDYVPADQTLSQVQHWTAATDADGILGSNGQPITIASNTTLASPISGNGRIVGVFDSGFSLSQVPSDLAEAIYSGVPGSQLAPFQGQDTWFVPCKTELNLTLVFGGQKIFIHPLDMITSVTGGPINPLSTCAGTFQPITANTKLPIYDAIWGMPVFRNAYVLLDFGNFTIETSTDQQTPFIQLLATTTNTTEAHDDFVNVLKNNGTMPSSSKSTPGSSISAATLSYTANALYWKCVAASLLVGIGALL
ncbi:hypothetical protein FRB97_007779 [Tulasnella sp. 331]|nr:hypothetical protein FRB97_007779 [Tulasnella sp. 331]